MGATSEDRFYKRKVNEFEQELKRLQRELAKLKVLKREGGRARKQLVRNLQREMELQSIFEQEMMDKLVDISIAKEKDEEKPHCKKCHSNNTKHFQAGMRTIIVCQDCESRSTIINDIAETA